MAWPTLTFPHELPPIVRKELEQLLALFEGLLSVSLHPDGTFKTIQAERILTERLEILGPEQTGVVPDGGTAGLQVLERFLNNTEIALLPTTRVRLLDGQGQDTLIHPVRWTIQADQRLAPYSGFSAPTLRLLVGSVVVAESTTAAALLGASSFHTGVLGVKDTTFAPSLDLSNQPLSLDANNPSGNFGGGSSANNWVVRVYYLTDPCPLPPVAPVVPPAAHCATTLWSDDFNGPAALSADYTNVNVGVVKVAGIGPDGSQGVRAPGIKEFWKELGNRARTGCCTFDVKTSNAGEYSYVMEARASTGWIFSIYRNDYDAPNKLELYTWVEGSSTPIYEQDNFWEPSAFMTLTVEWRLSTPLGFWSYDTDGMLRVKKNGTVVFFQDNIRLQRDINGAEWDRIVMSPQGDMDNLSIGE